MLSFASIQHEIQNMLDVPDELLSEEQKDAMDAYLKELAQMEANKIDSFATFIRLEQARAKAIKKEAQRLTAKARTVEKRIEGIKGYYIYIMTLNGLKKVAGTANTVSIGKTTTVEIDDAFVKYLPEKYVTTIIEPIKSAIKDALLAGEEIQGCRLIERDYLNIR